MTQPIAPPATQPLVPESDLVEAEKLVARLERMHDIRVNELLRAAATLMELVPVLRRLVGNPTEAVSHPRGDLSA